MTLIRTAIITVITILCVNSARSQFFHSIYDHYGRLRCDPSLEIENYDHLEILKGFDFSLDSIYNDIIYPKKAYENGIRGLVIAKITVADNGSLLTCDIVKTPDPIFIDPIKSAIYNHKEQILRQITSDSSLMFYLPFEFEIVSNSYKVNLMNYGVYKIQQEYKPSKKDL